MNIAIVDDDPADSTRLRSFIHTWWGAECSPDDELNITSYAGGEEMLRDFLPGTLQIVFMDILMAGINGVETAAQLRRLDPELLIIFLTTSKEYAFEAFPLHPFDYIIKPCTKKNVSKVLAEAMRLLDANDPKITLRVPYADYTLPVRDIASAVSQNHSVEVSLVNGKNLRCSMTFHEVEQELSRHSDFLLCNRGIIVNMSQISAMKDGTFIMRNGAVYPIRRNGGAKVRDTFSQYLITGMKASCRDKGREDG